MSERRRPPPGLAGLDEHGFERFIGLTEGEQSAAFRWWEGRVESVPEDADTRGVTQIAYSRSAMYTFGFDWLGLVFDVAAGDVLLAQTEKFETHDTDLNPPVRRYWAEGPHLLPRLCQFFDDWGFFDLADAYVTDDGCDAYSREMFTVVRAGERKTVRVNGELPVALLAVRFFVEGVLDTAVWYAEAGPRRPHLLYERDIKPRRSPRPEPHGFVEPIWHFVDGDDAA